MTVKNAIKQLTKHAEVKQDVLGAYFAPVGEYVVYFTANVSNDEGSDATGFMCLHPHVDFWNATGCYRSLNQAIKAALQVRIG